MFKLHIMENWTYNEIAELFGLHLTRISQLFKKYINPIFKQVKSEILKSEGQR